MSVPSNDPHVMPQLQRHPFLDDLASGVMVGDGAMGTELMAQGARPTDCLDNLTIEAPHLVEAVYRSYLLAGARVLETNTFGANRARLATFGLADSVRMVNQRAARLARNVVEAVGEPAFVAGAVGPTGRALRTAHSLTPTILRDMFVEQVEGLLAGGVDIIVLETFTDLDEIGEAIRAVRQCCTLPFVAQMTFTEGEMTPAGQTPEEVVIALEGMGASVIGMNCSVGPQRAISIVRRMAVVAQRPISAQPNAGLPAQVGGRVIYTAGASYMARRGVELAQAGARLVGGCCGTTPEYIRLLRNYLAEPIIARHDTYSPSQTRETTVPQQSSEEEPPLAARLRARQFVVSVEMRPPRGPIATRMLHGARLVHDCGVDAVNIFDGARAMVRMSTVAAATLIRQQVGVETILHMSTRDRSLMGLQADLIGAHALGARFILAVTGDPPVIGPYARSSGVFDVDSIGLLAIIAGLNRGEDVAGKSIGKPTRFVTGCALNPVAADLELEIDRFHQKIAAGAQFVMTQPVYDADVFLGVLDRLGPVSVPIVMGVLPLHSFRHAEFLRNEVPGVAPSLDALRRMEQAGADGIAEGARLGLEMVATCRRQIDGVYVMPSFDRYDVAAQFVSEIVQKVEPNVQ